MSAHHSPVLPPEHEIALHQVVMPAGVVVSASEPAHTALQSYACSQDETHNPATCLVPELLCLIFSQRYLSFADRMGTSHVCHAWRDASLALTFPATLWTRVPRTIRLDTMAPLLDRTAARGLPVDLMRVFLTRAPRLGAICELLEQHMWHIRNLGLTTLECTPSQRNDIRSAQQAPAPMLRCFSWEALNSWGSISHPDTWFFGGHAPQLERLELCARTATYLSSFTVFQSVRHIILGWVDICAEDELWRDLLKFQGLTDLDFETGPLRGNAAVRFAPGGGFPVPPAPTMISLPSTLARLRIKATSMSRLSVLDMDRIPVVRVAHLAPVPHSMGLRFMDAGVVKLLVHSSPAHRLPVSGVMETILNASSVSFRILDQERTRTRAFLNVDPAIITNPLFWESRFDIVASLTLYISTDFKGFAAVASCPNVEHLTVVLVERPDLDFPNIGLTFPNLRTLTLALVSPNRLGLDVDAVTAFISHLGYEAPKLETLRFRGTVAPAPVAAFDRLAEEVELDGDGQELASFPDLWEDM